MSLFRSVHIMIPYICLLVPCCAGLGVISQACLVLWRFVVAIIPPHTCQIIQSLRGLVVLREDIGAAMRRFLPCVEIEEEREGRGDATTQ